MWVLWTKPGLWARATGTLNLWSLSPASTKLLIQITDKIEDKMGRHHANCERELKWSYQCHTNILTSNNTEKICETRLFKIANQLFLIFLSRWKKKKKESWACKMAQWLKTLATQVRQPESSTWNHRKVGENGLPQSCPFISLTDLYLTFTPDFQITLWGSG